jgi:hypothetical protein
MMNARELADKFDALGVKDAEGRTIYANCWSPAGKGWSRIYFGTSKTKGGVDYGHAFVGQELSMADVSGEYNAIKDAVNGILGTDAPVNDSDVPF